MIHVIHSLNVLLPLVYGFSLLCYADAFRTGARRAGRIGSRALFVAVGIHATYLCMRAVVLRHFPITDFLESFSMIAFCLAGIHLIVERRVREEGYTGVFFVGIVFVFQLVSSMFVADIERIHPLLSNPLFGIHTTLTLFGVAGLATSAIYGMLYLMLAKNMKRQRFGTIYDRLPPLDTLEAMAVSALTVGIVVLGVGILMGHFWASRTDEIGTFFPMDARVLISDGTWLAYVVALALVRHRGWSGLRMGHFAVWSFLLYFSSMVAVNVFVPSFHSFHHIQT